MTITQAKKLEIITKHAKNYVCKSMATPILTGVHYAADGSVVVTDRYTLLRIGGAHAFSEPFTSDPKTGANLDGTYPDTSRIIPKDLPTEITLNEIGIKDVLARVKLALETSKVISDKSNIARIDVKNREVTLSVRDATKGMTYMTVFAGDVYGNDVSVTFNAQYLYNALSVVKDAGSREVIVGLTGEMSPIVVCDKGNEIDVIVLPYRLPKEAA